ncbi:MAG: radical SAM protein [Pseudomonadota bacterium]
MDRTAGERGRCGGGPGASVASVNLHRDEEPPVSASGGSGTVFFSGCGLRCVFCQNFPLSRNAVGRAMSPGELRDQFLLLEGQGAHNINLVTGTHFIPMILEALAGAIKEGLSIPILWNTGGYERIETLRLLDGVVDIYLADYKFTSPDAAAQIASAPDYPEVARRALSEMARQVGPLELDGRGAAEKGLIVRHLVLPGDLSGTGEVIDFVARDLPRGVALSLMSQYTPYAEAHDHALLNRKITKEEYDAALNCLDKSGITTGWIQEMAT